MAILKVNNLSKKFGQRVILKNATFSVEKGEFVALVGPSGSGKSTLLNILGLLEEKTAGSIIINGKNAPKITSKKAVLIRRNFINYLFQSYALISDQTVKSNLLLGMHFVKESSSVKQDKIAKVLNDLDISHLVNEQVNVLSSGEKQRVSLARAILKPGELVLADEPTGALDPKHAEIAFEQIENLRTNYGKTIIMVTHKKEEALKADRIIELTNFK